jgi:hypothetical protein
MEHAGSTLQRAVGQALRRSVPGEAAVLAWPLVCGVTVAERTRALKLADGILRVEVPDAVWREQLKALAPRYIAKLNGYAGKHVQGIAFVLPQKPGSTS